MQFALTHSASHSRLILLFAGWGADHHISPATIPGGYDLAIVWDYRDLTPQFLPLISHYEEIIVMAWSFGVPAASSFLSAHPALPVTATIAVCGTQHPVDPSLGIPPEIFSGTLASLSDASLRKFRMRMAGGAKAFAEAEPLLGSRPVAELRAELEAIGSRTGHTYIIWDTAVIGTRDAIIPPAAQQAAWTNEARRVISLNIPHLPDFAAILSRLITDKSLVAHRFARAHDTYTHHARVQTSITDRLLTLLHTHLHTSPHTILEIGGGTGRSTLSLRASFPTAQITVWDLTQPSTPIAPDVTTRCGDAETMIMHAPTESLDLIFSSSTVQWFNSLPRFLAHASRALRTGGLMAISTFGPDTMRELSGGTDIPRFPSAATLERMLPPDLHIETIEAYTQTLTFPTPREVLAHVRATGVNALRADGASHALRIIRSYPLTPGGEAPLTYQPIYLILRKQ